MQYFKFIEFLLTIMSPACLILLWNFVREISSYLILSCLLYTMLFRPWTLITTRVQDCV